MTRVSSLIGGLLILALTLGAWPHPSDAESRVDDEPTTATQADVTALREEVETLRALVDELAREMSRTRPTLSAFRLPETLTLAGEPVPLERSDVAERLEREFFLALAAPADAILWLKRSARYFPFIEERLQAAQLPDDLKYVAVAESALRPRAYSWAHASGIWQFIPDTARRYGLRVTRVWDERRDPERSTSAAIAYLRDLYGQFRDWPLALAAYNAGEGRVATALKTQGVSDYYRLVLPIETERYVFRVLAAKLILEAPDHYGFAVPIEDRYAPHETDSVTVPLPGSVAVRDLAAAAGSFYREILALNPAIMDDRLPAGRYILRVPRGAATAFAERVRSVKAEPAPATGTVTYRVKAGDTLHRIAQRFQVSVKDLRSWNRGLRGGNVSVGQVLTIRR